MLKTAADRVRQQVTMRARGTMSANRARGYFRRQLHTRARQVGGVLASANLPDELIEHILFNADRATIVSLCRTNSFYSHFCNHNENAFWLRWAEHYHQIPLAHLRSKARAPTASKQRLHRDIAAYVHSRWVLRDGWLSWLRAIRANARSPRPSCSFGATLTLAAPGERYVLEYDAAYLHSLTLILYSGSEQREWTVPHSILAPGTLHNPFPALWQCRDMVDFLTATGNPPIYGLRHVRFNHSVVSATKHRRA